MTPILVAELFLLMFCMLFFVTVYVLVPNMFSYILPPLLVVSVFPLDVLAATLGLKRWRFSKHLIDGVNSIQCKSKSIFIIPFSFFLIILSFVFPVQQKNKKTSISRILPETYLL